jgi:hypothetical protein
MTAVQVPKEQLISRAKAFNADALWFEENLDAGQNVRVKYAERFVAVYNGQVIDSDRDLRRLLSRLSRKYSADEVGSFFIEYVTRSKTDLII